MNRVRMHSSSAKTRERERERERETETETETDRQTDRQTEVPGDNPYPSMFTRLVGQRLYCSFDPSSVVIQSLRVRRPSESAGRIDRNQVNDKLTPGSCCGKKVGSFSVYKEHISFNRFVQTPHFSH